MGGQKHPHDLRLFHGEMEPGVFLREFQKVEELVFADRVVFLVVIVRVLVIVAVTAADDGTGAAEDPLRIAVAVMDKARRARVA